MPNGRSTVVMSALIALVVTPPAPAFSSFNLDYVVKGRIWVPSLVVEPQGLVSSNRVVGLSDVGGCKAEPVKRDNLLEPRERDCRFERQLVDALAVSGLFRRVARAPLGLAEIDLMLSPRRSRVQFRRQVIRGVKPLVVLTFFTYLWTPLPFEVDVESYDLRVAVLDPAGQLLSEVAVAREFTHYLSAYSAERTAPEDLLAELEPSERALRPIIVCRGPHAGVAVHELLQRLSAAVKGITGEFSRHSDFGSAVRLERQSGPPAP